MSAEDRVRQILATPQTLAIDFWRQGVHIEAGLFGRVAAAVGNIDAASPVAQ